MAAVADARHTQSMTVKTRIVPPHDPDRGGERISATDWALVCDPEKYFNCKSFPELKIFWIRAKKFTFGVGEGAGDY